MLKLIICQAPPDPTRPTRSEINDTVSSQSTASEHCLRSLVFTHYLLVPWRYPLIPVSVMPWINSRWAKKNSSTTGSIVTSEAAIR